jgi:hypothetical protein
MVVVYEPQFPDSSNNGSREEYERLHPRPLKNAWEIDRFQHDNFGH